MVDPVSYLRFVLVLLAESEAEHKFFEICEGVQHSNGEVKTTLLKLRFVGGKLHDCRDIFVNGFSCTYDGILCIDTEMGTLRVFLSNAFMQASVLLFTCAIRPSAIAKLLLCRFFFVLADSVASVTVQTVRDGSVTTNIWVFKAVSTGSTCKHVPACKFDFTGFVLSEVVDFCAALVFVALARLLMARVFFFVIVDAAVKTVVYS